MALTVDDFEVADARLQVAIDTLRQQQRLLQQLRTPSKSEADYFVSTLRVNVDNLKLSDEAFRGFVRCSIRDMK